MRSSLVRYSAEDFDEDLRIAQITATAVACVECPPRFATQSDSWSLAQVSFAHFAPTASWQGNCFHFRFCVASFPKKKEIARLW
jgi:hypothetical protein